MMKRVISMLIAALSMGGCSDWSAKKSQSPTGVRRPAAENDMLATTTWDLNRDGIFTCDEWKQYASLIFRRADRNHDGFVSAEEFATIRQADPSLASADLAYFDGNNDGRLSHAEFVDKPSPFFARYDANGDCRVTPAEFAAQRTPVDRDESKKGKRGPVGR